jgi:hypothetical protein
MFTHDSFSQHTLPLFVALQLLAAASGWPGTARYSPAVIRRVRALARNFGRDGFRILLLRLEGSKVP